MEVAAPNSAATFIQIAAHHNGADRRLAL